VPKIPPEYLNCSIYLYSSKDAAEKGENFGGSGCLVAVYPKPIFDPKSFKGGRYTKVLALPRPHIYAVTNKHVARQGCPVIRINMHEGKPDVLELEHHDWIPHPEGDDLAIAPIELPDRKHDYYPIDSYRSFVRSDDVNMGGGASDIAAGDDTFMVGRFISHEGKQRNTPTLRFGSIAMLPFDKVRLANGYMQEAFLVETRSLSGYSGSPVFVYRPAQQTTAIPPSPDNPYAGDTYATSITNLVGQPTLLGIDCGHIPRPNKVVDASGAAHPEGWTVESNTGIAVVVPAWRLNDLLNDKDLALKREQIDKQRRNEVLAEVTVQVAGTGISRVLLRPARRRVVLETSG
jgi:hypothetical protein